MTCYVRAATHAEAFLMAEAKNLQQNEYIDPIAEVNGFKMLQKKGLTESDIAKSIGKTQQYVSARLAAPP